jgi:hypothetical protein
MADYKGSTQTGQQRQVVHTPRAGRSPQSMASDYSGWVGWILFAALMLVLTGISHVIQGLLALFNDDYYDVGSSRLTLDVGYSTWGWVHIVAGVVAVAAGVYLFAGRMWARVIGTIVAGVSAIISLGFLAAYPFGSALLIAINILVILALTVHGSEIVDHG